MGTKPMSPAQLSSVVFDTKTATNPYLFPTSPLQQGDNTGAEESWHRFTSVPLPLPAGTAVGPGAAGQHPHSSAGAAQPALMNRPSKEGKLEARGHGLEVHPQNHGNALV